MGVTERWAHVDINAYFATLLQQENPFLRGRPVGVVKEAGRTCIIAASKEAKLLGVKTGCRVKDARQLAPDITLVPAEFGMYLNATKRLLKVFHSLVPNVEIFSLDEAFLDLSDCAALYPNPLVFGRLAQSRIKEELGSWVTCNVGIGPNRFLAKMTGEISPKGSVTQVTDDSIDAMLAKVTFADTCGIGYRLGARLEAMGIKNPWAINLLSDADLFKNFGPFWSVELRKMGQGEEPYFLTRHHERGEQSMKSVGRSITGYKLCDSEESIRRVLLNLVEEATYKARRMGLAGRHVAVGLSGDDSGWYAHRTLPHHINRADEVFSIIYNELYKPWTRNFSVIKFWVSLSQLVPQANLSPTILAEWQRKDRLMAARDEISQKFGLFTVRPGTLFDPQVIIRPEVTGYLGDQQYSLNVAAA